MFSEVQRAHAQKQAAGREATDKAKRESVAAIADVATVFVDTVNKGVHETFEKEKQIETEIRQLATIVQRFQKQQLQWKSTFSAFDDALKEIGDFENWIKIIDYDFQVVAKTLEIISNAKP